MDGWMDEWIVGSQSLLITLLGPSSPSIGGVGAGRYYQSSTLVSEVLLQG